MRALLLAVMLSVGCIAAHTQTITLQTHATSDDLLRWLSSGDPRLVAWAATLAREQNDPAALDAMANMTERWSDATKGDKRGPESGAMTAVLDALIQRNHNVTASGLRAIGPSFNQQAAILATRLPLSTSAPVLMDWYRETPAVPPDLQELYELTFGKHEGRPITLLGEIAGDLLVKAPPPGFAALVASESVEKLYLQILSPNHGAGLGGSGPACGDRLGSRIPSGWPEIYLYDLQSSSPSGQLSILVEGGGETLYYGRHARSTGWGSCDPLPYPATLRHRWIAEMLGTTPQSLPWQSQTVVSMPLTDAETLRQAVQARVDQEERKLDATVALLMDKGYLTPNEAQTARTSLVVILRDLREDRKTSPLPSIPLSGTHLTSVVETN